ncbi:MAG TPA: hypothetical protein VLE53_17145 [Gemmatimonadaceae bacterium]|nr:hypothetical protein [Gemmatimonadaceae bacterium]
MTRFRRRTAGLTYLEVMVALVLLALSVVGLIEVRAQGLAAGRSAEAMQRALAAADTALERARPRRDGVASAMEATIGGFAVRTTTRPWRGRVNDGVGETRVAEVRVAEVRVAVALAGRDTLVIQRLVRP